jgi:hypothetical protein
MSLALQRLPKLRGYLESTATKALSQTLGAYPTKLVRIIYSDEAGIGDEVVEPILVVAAVMIDGDHQWPVIDFVIQGILDKYVPAERRDSFEFKASRLFGQLSKGSNEVILREFLRIIETFQLPVLWGAIDRVGMRRNWEASGLACSVETIQNFAFVGAAVHAETALAWLWPHERAI